MSCRGWGQLIAATCWASSDSSSPVWSASSKSPSSFVIQPHVTTIWYLNLFFLYAAVDNHLVIVPACRRPSCWTALKFVCHRGAGVLFYESVFGFWTLTLMRVGWIWWMVVVDHCHCRSGESCRMWQQSDMVIQSWGYEWLGVGFVDQMDSINSSEFREGVSCRAPAGSWQDVSAVTQNQASLNTPQVVFHVFKISTVREC